MATIAQCYEMQELSPCLMQKISAWERQVNPSRLGRGERRFKSFRRDQYWGIAKLVRHRILAPAFRRFESCFPSQYFIWRGVEEWYLVGLITQRLLVQLQPPPPIWGRSSIGRAFALQAKGREFDSRRFHHFCKLLKL